MPQLEGVKMELQDSAFPLLREVIIGSDPRKVFEGINWALLIGAKPRSAGMERKDLLHDNGRIFQEQGRALSDVASPDIRVLVVGNPCNTNCLIALHNAKNIPPMRFFAMTRLDENRAKAYLAEKAHYPVEAVTRMAIWGNHSSTQVPDAFHALIDGRPATEVIDDRAWLEGELIHKVQTRGAEILKARGKSSAGSAASAICDAVRALTCPTKEGDWFSSAIYSADTSYNIDRDLVFSLPCRFSAYGVAKEVAGIDWNPFLEAKIRATEKELIEERNLSKELLKG